VGGILLAVGIGTRLIALVLFVNMTVAFWVAEKEAFLGVLSSPDKFQAADAYNYWFAALLILILGPGLFAVDTLIGRWVRGLVGGSEDPPYSRSGDRRYTVTRLLRRRRG
jgi:putative oxidoreductase